MSAKSPSDVIPRTRKEIGVKKTMFVIFFASRKLLTREYLLKGQKDNQHYFISDSLPESDEAKKDISGGSKVGLFTYILIT
jgi:hypothetical protein